MAGSSEGHPLYTFHESLTQHIFATSAAQPPLFSNAIWDQFFGVLLDKKFLALPVLRRQRILFARISRIGSARCYPWLHLLIKLLLQTCLARCLPFTAQRPALSHRRTSGLVFKQFGRSTTKATFDGHLISTCCTALFQTTRLGGILSLPLLRWQRPWLALSLFG